MNYKTEKFVALVSKFKCQFWEKQNHKIETSLPSCIKKNRQKIRIKKSAIILYMGDF